MPSIAGRERANSSDVAAVPPPIGEVADSSDIEFDATGVSVRDEDVVQKLERLESELLRLSRQNEEEEKGESGMEAARLDVNPCYFILVS